MNEFGNMIKEAFLGLEAFDALPGKAEIQKSIEAFDRRERTMRVLTWVSVFLMAALLIGVVVSWFQAGADASTKELLTHLALFTFSLTGIGLMKIWFFVMQFQIATLRELKRTQMMVLESNAPGAR
jgi:small-conductance mechanosensitive channel